jgi:RNA polymerase sigma-70 factor (ECF subfamily)
VSIRIKLSMGGEDRLLVEKALAGEEGAFEDLVRKYQAPLYYFTLRFVRDEQAAADLAQTTFLRAFKGLQGFRQEASFKTWLYRIAINLSKNYLRDRGKKEFESSKDIDPPSHSNPLRELIAHEEQRLLVQAWGQLPERQRLTVTLKVQEGMKYREIAEVLGCSVGAVKANFHHACMKLKEILREERDEMS